MNPDHDKNIDEQLTAEQLIEKYLVADGPRACVTCSFQAEGVVLTHLLRQVDPNIPVIFLDTGYHFAETYAYRDRLARKWRLNLINVEPRMTVEQQEAARGLLYQTDPAQCCYLRKIEPLKRALADYDIWFTGLRREQSPTRRNVGKRERHQLAEGKSLLKINPLADWTRAQVWDYLLEHGIEYLPLYEHGYTSIGCAPCTNLPSDPNDLRSGRWNGRRLECGLHTFTERV